MRAEKEVDPEKEVMSMYKGAKTRVRVGGGHSKELDVSVGVHQESLLSRFVLTIVLDVLSEDGGKGGLMKCFMQMTWF